MGKIGVLAGVASLILALILEYEKIKEILKKPQVEEVLSLSKTILAVLFGAFFLPLITYGLSTQLLFSIPKWVYWACVFIGSLAGVFLAKLSWKEMLWYMFLIIFIVFTFAQL